MELYKLREVAEKFRVTVRTIRNWMKSGKIEAIKIGGQYRVKQSEVTRLLNNIEIMPLEEIKTSPESDIIEFEMV